MKIDVEGYESCVVAGGNRLFEVHGVAIVFLEVWSSICPCMNNTMALVNYFSRLGYEFFETFDEFKAGSVDMRISEDLQAIIAKQQFIELVLVRRDLLTEQ
jgi:hypothetical protein